MPGPHHPARFRHLGNGPGTIRRYDGTPTSPGRERIAAHRHRADTRVAAMGEDAQLHIIIRVSISPWPTPRFRVVATTSDDDASRQFARGRFRRIVTPASCGDGTWPEHHEYTGGERYDGTPDCPQQFVSRVTPGHSPSRCPSPPSRCPRSDARLRAYNPRNPYKYPRPRLFQGL